MRPTTRWPGTTIRLPPPCPLHEPPPLPPFGHPLPRGGGEGRGEGAVGWFKGARHAQSSGRSLLGERAGVRASVSSNPIFGVGGSRYFRFQISDFGFQTQPPYVGCYAFWRSEERRVGQR